MSKMLVPRLERGQDDDDGVLENCPRVDKMFLKYAMESKEWRELEEEIAVYIVKWKVFGGDSPFHSKWHWI